MKKQVISIFLVVAILVTMLPIYTLSAVATDDETVMGCPWESHDTVCFDETVEPSCTSAGYDVYWCDTCQRSFNGNYVTELDHNFENGTCTVCNVLEEDCIETEHPYSRPCDLTWTIHKESATSITITFSSLTMTAGCDSINIYDGEDNLITIGDTWGGILANESITVWDDTVKICFTAYEDYYGSSIDYTTYGFKIINVVANYEPVPDYEFEYEVISEDEKTAAITDYTRYNNSVTEVEIPTTIDGYTITTIGEYAFYYCTSLTSIIIPDSVTTIDEYAFCDCTSLASVTLPNSVSTIGEGAFSYCENLTDVYYAGTESQWNAIEIQQWNEYLTSAIIHFNPTSSIVLNGWVAENGKWAYYENGVKATNKWLKDSVGWCYVGEDGYCVTNAWKADSVGWCYLDANGRMVINNWVYSGGKWYFMDGNGYMVSNTWKKDSKGWCYLGSSGAMLTNAWVKDSVGWCYVGANGYCVTNKWVKDSKGWCYLDNNGRMVYNKWVKDSKGWCYVGSSGYMVTNQWVKDAGKWYYLDANGYMVTGTKVIGGKTYKFASNGVWIG